MNPGSWYSNKISLSQEPKSGPIPDDHSHHAAYEGQFHDILRGGLIGVFQHHLRCKFNAAHPSSELIYQTAADIFLAALHLILAIAETFGLTPLQMNGMTSPSTESLSWALAIVAGGTSSKTETALV